MRFGIENVITIVKHSYESPLYLLNISTEMHRRITNKVAHIIDEHTGIIIKFWFEVYHKYYMACCYIYGKDFVLFNSEKFDKSSFPKNVDSISENDPVVKWLYSYVTEFINKKEEK